MKNNEGTIVKIILIVAILSIGYIGSRLVGDLYYNKLTTESKTLDEFRNQYQERINKETDPQKAAQIGTWFMKANDYEIAEKAFIKTTDLDGKWRDGWIWRSYSELELGKANEAVSSLKKAEELDPIYPLTYQLLTLAYQQSDNLDQAKASQEKFTYLSKNYSTSN